MEPLEPVPQQEGPQPVCAILYTPQFVQTMDSLRALLRADERSARALQVTQQAIALNPANYTAWHFRRLCLEHTHADLGDELQFVAQCALDNPKNYQLW
jgi:protein farnesyltransferase/geranylgeranyltransferase type-1 subunit alpha